MNQMKVLLVKIKRQTKNDMVMCCVCVCVYVESLMIRKAKGVQWQNTDPLTKWQL